MQQEKRLIKSKRTITGDLTLSLSPPEFAHKNTALEIILLVYRRAKTLVLQNNHLFNLLGEKLHDQMYSSKKSCIKKMGPGNHSETCMRKRLSWFSHPFTIVRSGSSKAWVAGIFLRMCYARQLKNCLHFAKLRNLNNKY